MATSSASLFASSRHSKAFGLVVAGGILFLVGVGGSGALLSAYTGPIAQTAGVQAHRV